MYMYIEKTSSIWLSFAHRAPNYLGVNLESHTLAPFSFSNNSPKDLSFYVTTDKLVCFSGFFTSERKIILPAIPLGDQQTEKQFGRKRPERPGGHQVTQEPAMFRYSKEG